MAVPYLEIARVGIQIAGNVAKIAGGIDELLFNASKALYEGRTETEKAVSQVTKTLGITGDRINSITENVIKEFHDANLVNRFNASPAEYLKVLNTYNQTLGRAVDINKAGTEQLLGMRHIMGDEKASQFASSLENFGVSLPETGKLVGKMYKDAGKSGISFEKYSKNFLENIKMANKYTFKDGLEGLKSMSKYAAEIGLDMQQAADLADKLREGGVEGAAEMGAQLQVLGGNFAALGNPLTMLNEGLNDLEGLHKRLGDMVGRLGHFNTQTGAMEISTFNQMQLKQASKAMGVNYDELLNSAQRQGLRKEIGVRATNAGIDSELKSVLQNVGVIQRNELTGKYEAGANIDGKFTRMEEIAASITLREKLLKQNVAQGDNIADIAVNVKSIADRFEGAEKNLLNTQEYQMSTSNNFSRYKRMRENWLRHTEEDAESINNRRLTAQEFQMWFETLGFHNGGSITGGKYANGGITGPSHNDGGIKIANGNIEVEGGEYIVNKNAMKNPVYASVIESINESTNDGPSSSYGKYSNGGNVSNTSSIINRINNLFKTDNSNVTNSTRGISNISSKLSRIFNEGAISNIKNAGDSYFSDFISKKSDIGDIMSSLIPSFSIARNDSDDNGIKKYNVSEPTQSRNEYNTYNNTNGDINGKMALDISGTIKLESPNGKSVDFTQLLHEPFFVRELSRVIAKTVDGKRGVYGTSGIV